MNLEATYTYNFVLFSHLLFPPTQHFWNCWSSRAGAAGAADLMISSDLHEREREILYGKLRSLGKSHSETTTSKQQGTLHYEIHMRILLLPPSNHIMILWKEFPHYSHNNYGIKESNTSSYFTWDTCPSCTNICWYDYY
jgi:hypothetical protein